MAWLDSVRGLAALTVVGSHYVRAYDLPCRGEVCKRLLSNTPLHVWWEGGAAVSLFFVLSGLVLSLRHFRHGARPGWGLMRPGAYARYAIGRVCRVWLPYLAVLAVSALLYPHAQAGGPPTLPLRNDWLPSFWARPAGWADFVQDSFLLGWRMDMVYVPQAWTLSIELALSLFVPLGIALAAGGTLALLAAALAAVALFGASPFVLHFTLGILLARRHEGLGLWLRRKVWARRCGWALGFFLYTVEETLGGRLDPRWVDGCTGLGSALLLASAFGSARAQKLLSLSALRQIGKVSFSLYLLHFAVLAHATPWFLAWLDAPPGAFVAAWWLGLAANLAASIGLAALCYRWVEVPAMALGKRLGRALDGGPQSR